jgi:prophage DNA circulation protein
MGCCKYQIKNIMGILISTYKANGNEFVNAYAKIDNLRYDNKIKVASFDVSVYPAKGDNNAIEKAATSWARITEGSDMVAQCYDKLSETISYTNDTIARLESEIATIEDGQDKIRKEFELARLKGSKLIQLQGEEL